MSRAPPTNGYWNMSNGSTPSLPKPSAMTSQTRLASPQSRQHPQSSGASPAAMSRAERFEDEKRRIIESCFSKLDQNGQLVESYITHIRILEDAQHPSTPAPPESSPENKKSRAIIIAVRSTGRVRMHKARENNNGSFSIGKTWNMEELSAIESFSNSAAPPQHELEDQYRRWAGSVGFVVTITKPYYWEAGTSKEKEFFIASTVKIYRKYTKGEIPDMIGFDEKDMAIMLGAPPSQQQQQQQQPPPREQMQSREQTQFREQSQRPRNEMSPPAAPQPPFAKRDQSRDESRYRGSPGPPPSMSDLQPPSPFASRQASASPARPPRSGESRPFGSQDQYRSQSREGLRSPDHVGRLGRSPGPASGSARSPPPHQQPFQPPLGKKSSHSQLRSDSPSVSNVSPVGVREALPKVQPIRSQSPPRQFGRQQSVDGVPEDTAPPGSPDTGPSLFQATRQRWMTDQPQQSQQPQQPKPPPTATTPPSSQPPQLSPIETSQPWQPQSSHQQTPSTAGSSAGHVDLGDAAAVGAITAFWGEEPQYAAVAPASREPSSPPTPERSAKRPAPHMRTKSDASADLRPPPLSQAQGQRSPQLGSAYATPQERSAQTTPKTEEPPTDIPKPLSLQKNRSDGNLTTLGALSQSPLGPSPLSSAPETPGDERNKEQALEPAEPFRPGLGPMIKRDAVRDRFKKAATAATAFKPRPGGAAEKILKAKAERDANGEPDGITGVVPRPVPRQEQEVDRRKDDLAVKEPPALAGLGLALGDAHLTAQEQPPKVEVSSPLSPGPGHPGIDRQIMDGTSHSVQLADDAPINHLQTPAQQQQQDEEEEREKLEQKEIRKAQVKVKRRSGHQEKYLAALGIERSLLEGKGLDFEQTLADFGWKDNVLQPKQLQELESDLRREQGRLEAGSWLSHSDLAREEKVAQVDALLDKAILECDELEGLLTLYNVELSSLNEDIAFIEAQSQGLQVQSANQKLLHNELQGLVETMSLDRRVLEPLRYGDLADTHAGGGLEEVEQSLVRLYQALVTIDPSIRSNAVGGRPKSRSALNGEGANELSNMKALREKRDGYDRETTAFCQRLMQHLDFTFTMALNGAKNKMLRPASGGPGGLRRLNKDTITEARRGLWIYSPLLLFAKELNPPAWQTLLRVYYSKAQPMYADAFKDNLGAWKQAARKPSPDEADLLFTAQEKDDAASGSVGLSTARKLTVKRSQTLAKTLRNASGGDKHGSPTDSRYAGSNMPSEVFAGAMDEMAPLISQEQNFIVDLFHATSLEAADFLDTVDEAPPRDRHGTNLMQSKQVDPDRDLARRVTGVMDEVFGFFTTDISSLLEWSIANDPIQGVGVMACLSRHTFYLQETSQEFLLQLVESLSTRLQGLWVKFVDEQVRAIEDTKVKIKKRKGVIGFMKIFPHFSAAVENVFSGVAQQDYDGPAECMVDVRKLVDDAYARINRAMFDSLKVIAKESPAGGAGQQGRVGVVDDPEDKEMLNYHILLIENMNHYVEEVDDGNREGVLAEWRGQAMLERLEALEAYVGRVIRRPLGKLLDFLDSLESLAASQPDPKAIASRPSYSRKSARNLFSQYDGRELRRGIDTLRKRIEKHFGEADEEAISRTLVNFVCKECERSYEVAIDRAEKLIKDVYPATDGEKSVEIEFSKADVQASFRR